MKLLALALASASLLSVAPAFAQSTTTTSYGSAVLDTKRNCPANATTACDGLGAGQGIAQRATYGGAGQAVTSNFTATGTGIGSHAESKVSFSEYGLPVIKTNAYAVGNVRIGSNNYAYQSYTYTGTESFDLLINALFHIDDASTDGANGTLAHGALATAGFAIWKASDFFAYADPAWTENYTGLDGGFANPTNMTSQNFLFGGFSCSDFASLEMPSNPLATAGARANMAGGETSFGVTQETCGGGNGVTINPGDQFVIATYTQLIANRDGFIDAMGTFTVNLDPTMSTAAVQAFAQNTTFDTPAASDVPEPASWAMMIAGFGAIGGALRRKRAALPALR